MGLFGMGGKRRVLALAKDGARTAVDADTVLVQSEDGRELAISFSDHHASRGGVMLRSGFAGFRSPEIRGPAPHDPEVVTGIVLLPSSGNGVTASVWARRRLDGVPLVERGGAPPPVRLTALRGGVPVGVSADSLVMEFGSGADLTVSAANSDPLDGLVALQAGPMWTPAQVERLKSGSSEPSSGLNLSFGGCNIVHVLVPRRKVRLCG